MNKINIENLFKNSEHNFDIENPESGHKERFLNKLSKHNASVIKTRHSPVHIWKPLIGIAASIALILSLVTLTTKQSTQITLADISPEMAKTESLFMANFTNEIKHINSEDMPEYQELIVDALFQIKMLEEDFKQLIIGLKENPEDELVLSAMILNFQKRIDVLQDTKDKIETLKQNNNNVNII